MHECFKGVSVSFNYTIYVQREALGTSFFFLSYLHKMRETRVTLDPKGFGDTHQPNRPAN